jgi:HEAT repeat protein
MKRNAWVMCVLLALQPLAGTAQSDEEKSTREFIKRLAKERDPKERADAAHALGGRANPDAVAALAKALSDSDATVRQAAASALWDTGKGAAAAKPELQKTLDDPDAAVVARAAGALAAMDVPDKELAPAWRRALDGAKDDATAFLAARGLIGIDPAEKLAPPILTWLSKKARAAAHPARGQSSYDERKSAEAAQEALSDLLKDNPAPLLPQLDSTVRTTPESGRYVLAALGSVKKLPPGTVDLALKHTNSSEPDTRYAAISLAGKVKSEREVARWVPEAVRLLADPDESVRMQACWVLKDVRGLAHSAGPELARLVSSDRSMSVRARAASAVEEIGDASNPIAKADKVNFAAATKSAVAPAMKDKDHDLAVAAVAAYNVLYLDTTDVVAALADAAVSGTDVAARQKALQCLRNRQGQARSAVETIRPLTRSADKLIADDAKTAIEWIERGGTGSPNTIKAGAVAASAASAAPAAHAAPEAPGRKASTESAASEAPSGNEERGLSVLRERHLEFNEESFNHALAQADGEAIRAYLDAGMSAKHVFVGDARRTPLMVLFFGREACAKGAQGREIVSLLLKRGADVNQVDQNKNTALMFAADSCDRETLRMLLKAGARLDARNQGGLTALQMGIVTGNPGLEELIAAGARLDPATAKAYAEAYKSNPKALALVKKASQ